MGLLFWFIFKLLSTVQTSEFYVCSLGIIGWYIDLCV